MRQAQLFPIYGNIRKRSCSDVANDLYLSKLSGRTQEKRLNEPFARSIARSTCLHMSPYQKISRNAKQQRACRIRTCIASTNHSLMSAARLC